MSVPEVKLDELYQEVILDHNKRPRNFKKLDDANAVARGVNPLCGDQYHLYLKLEGGKVGKVGFEGSGCAISKSSASMMTTMIENKTTGEVSALKDEFLRLLTGEKADMAKLGGLKIFEGVKRFPVRVKCATLIWRTLEEALKDTGHDTAKQVTTESDDVKNIS